MADLPIGYTTNYNLALWNDGDNPGATALNGNMTSIDTALKDLSNNMSVVAIAPLSQSGKNLTLNFDTSNLKLDNLKLNTIQNISTISNVQFNKIGVGVSSSNVYQLDVSGNQHVYGSIYVDGDIHLKGWVAQDNYTELTILDNKIKLNRSGSNVTAAGSGLLIEGDNFSTVASITYDGSNWVLDKDLTVNKVYIKDNITLQNKTGNGWLNFATRNVSGTDAVYDITNVGSITTNNQILATGGTIQIKKPDFAYLYASSTNNSEAGFGLFNNNTAVWYMYKPTNSDELRFWNPTFNDRLKLRQDGVLTTFNDVNVGGNIAVKGGGGNVYARYFYDSNASLIMTMVSNYAELKHIKFYDDGASTALSEVQGWNWKLKSSGTNDYFFINYSGGFEFKGNVQFDNNIYVLQSIGVGTTDISANARVDIRSPYGTNATGLIVYGYSGDNGFAIRGYGYAAEGAGTGTNYGIWGASLGSRSVGTNIGGYFEASGAPNSYALLTGVGNVGFGTTSPIYKLHVIGDIYANGGWLRSSGNTGWFNESYGGGWYMTDSTWLRNYSYKGLMIEQADIQQTGTKSIYNDFRSGIFGTGWKIDYKNLISGESYLEVDNIMVRNTLRTHIFQKDVVKVTNGYLYVSDSGVISSFDTANNRVGFSNEKSATFVNGTKLWVKDWNPSTGTIIGVKFSITSTYSTTSTETIYIVTVDSGTLSDLVIGLTAARISGGSLLMDASSVGSPYLDVVLDGVTKTRLGNLAGWTSTVYGTYQGWGLASENVYLSGNANIVGTLTAGDANGWGNTFYAGKIRKNLLNNSALRAVDFTRETLWTSSTTSTDVVAPDGSSTTVKAVTGTSGNPYYYQWLGTLSPNTTYTLSVWARCSSGTNNVTFAFEDRSNSKNANKSISLSTAWKRYSITVTMGATTPDATLIGFVFPDANMTMYTWGWQLEEGSIITPYQSTDNTLSSSTGYGMWSTAGGFGGTIQNPAISLSDYGIIVRKQGATAGWRNNNTISIGYYGSTEWGIKGRDGSGNAVFDLGDTNQIAGWTFTNNTLTKHINSNTLILGRVNDNWSTQNCFSIGMFDTGTMGFRVTGNNNSFIEIVQNDNSVPYMQFSKDANNLVGIGATSAWGIDSWGMFVSSGGNVIFKATDAGGLLAGWNFDNKKLYNGTDIVLDAYNKKVSVFNDAVKMYYSASSDYGIKDSAGKFQLGSTNKIAGWTFDTSKIFNNNVSIESAGNLLNSSGGWNFYNDGHGNIGTGDTGISWTSGGAVTLGKNVTLAWAKTTGINLLQQKYDLDWKVASTPNQTGFVLSGQSGENAIVSYAGPFGVPTNVWKSMTVGNNSGDGGFENGPTLTIDRTKTYRYAIWFRVENDLNGNVYFGCATDGTVSSLTGNSSDSVNTNPYFLAHGRSQFISGKWYLAVGYIHPAGYTGTSYYGAVYDSATGKAVTSLTDFKFMSTATTANIRAFMYYCNTTNPVTYFYNPVVHEVNGSEPSIYNMLGMNVTTLNNYMVASPRIVGGNDGSNYVELSSNGLKAFNGGNQKVHVSSSGDGWFGASNKFYWDASGNVTAGGWTLNNGYLDGTNMQIYGGSYPYIQFYDQSNGTDYVTLGCKLYDGSWHNDWNGMIFRANSQNWFQMYTSGDGATRVAQIAGWQFNASSLYKNTDSNNGVRLDSSDTFSGLAVKSGGNDVLKVGKYTAGSLLNTQRTVSGTWSGVRTTGFNGSINNGVVGVGQITSPYVINSGYNYATVTYTSNESLQNKWVRIKYTASISGYDDSIGCYTSDYQISSNYPISLTGRTWSVPDGTGVYKTYDSGWFYNTSTGNFLTLSLSNSQDNGDVGSPYGFTGGSLSVTIETKDSLPAADLSPNTLRIYNYGGLEGLFYDSDGLKVKGKSVQVGNWELKEGTPVTGKKGGNLEVYFNGSLVTTLATAPTAPAI